MLNAAVRGSNTLVRSLAHAKDSRVDFMPNVFDYRHHFAPPQHLPSSGTGNRISIARAPTSHMSHLPTTLATRPPHATMALAPVTSGIAATGSHAMVWYPSSNSQILTIGVCRNEVSSCNAILKDNANFPFAYTGETKTGTCVATFMGSPTMTCTNTVWGAVSSPCVST